jgi:hypothetical protein
MAKILPAGANVDLNLGKDPMDRLVQTVDLALKVGGAFQQAQERRQVKREQDALGVGSLANELINKASSGAEINHALSLMENVDTSNLSASTQSFYQAAKSSGNSRLSQINEIQSLGNEIATFVTQPLIDGKTFTQLNKEEIVNYYNQTNELDSAFEETMNNLAKIKRFKLLTEGSNNKNMKFTGFGGKQMSASEFIVDVDNYSSSKNVFIQASVYDNELLPEEAIFVMTGDRDSYNQRKKQRDKEFQSFKKDYDAKIKSINSTINQINTDALKNKNNYTELVLNNENKQTFVSSFGQLYPDVSISTDIDEAYEQATQYMTNINLSPEELIKNLNQQKTALEGERLIVSKEAKGWGFRYFEPIDVSMFENANKDGGTADVGTSFMDNFKKGVVPPDIKITLPELKKYNFDNSTIKTEDKKEDMPLNAGTTSIITNVMKKYEGINQDTNPNLVEVNNLYAIKFGDRAESYGAKDSGIQASDGGTFASFNSLEEADIAASKIVADMLDKDAKGDLKTFIGNYIGATPENPKTDEINTRYNEIVELSTALPKTEVKPLTSKEINPKALDRAERMFLNWKTTIEKSIDSTKNKIESIENKIAQIEKNTKTKEGSLTTKEKQVLKTKQKFKKQLKTLKDDLRSETEKLKNTDIDNWYNNFATKLEVDRLIKIGAGNPKQEVEEDAFLKGIADTKGIPSLDEGIFKTLYDELRPGSPLRNR